jgi:hypothetical protein
VPDHGPPGRGVDDAPPPTQLGEFSQQARPSPPPDGSSEPPDATSCTSTEPGPGRDDHPRTRPPPRARRPLNPPQRPDDPGPEHQQTTLSRRPRAPIPERHDQEDQQDSRSQYGRYVGSIRSEVVFHALHTIYRLRPGVQPTPARAVALLRGHPDTWRARVPLDRFTCW